MSSVRMCDQCGRIFSENEDGWQTFVGTTIDRDDSGRQQARSVQVDACPQCAVGRDTVRPMIAAPAPEDDADAEEAELEEHAHRTSGR